MLIASFCGAARPRSSPRARLQRDPRPRPKCRIPLLATWTRPLRRRAAVRQGQGRALQAGARGGDGRAARRDRRDRRTTRRRRPSRTRSPRWSAPGRTLDRVRDVYGICSRHMSTPEFQAVEREMAPKLAAFDDEITQNEKLFARIAAVYDARETAKPHARAAAARLARLHELRARRRASSTPRPRSALAEINQRLADALHDFSQNVLADEDELRARARQARPTSPGCPTRCARAPRRPPRRAGTKGKWAITNTRSCDGAVPHLLDRRDLREKVWRTFVQPRRQRRRARQQRRSSPRSCSCAPSARSSSAIATHAHWRLENTHGEDARARHGADGGGVEAGGRARARGSRRHAGDRRRGGRRSIKIEPWDYRYYAEKVRKAKYDLDQNEVKPYLQLDKLREGMFWVAGELFGFSFTPVDRRAGLPPRRPRLGGEGRARGKHVGLWYFDPYARPGKRSGAWMNAYRNQERFDGDDHDHRLEQLELREGQARRAGAHQLGRRARRCSTSSATRCTACSSNVTYPSLVGHATWRATTSSSRRSSSSTGCRRPRC